MKIKNLIKVISKMNVREYAKYEEEIDKAVREGRIQP